MDARLFTQFTKDILEIDIKFIYFMYSYGVVIYVLCRRRTNTLSEGIHNIGTRYYTFYCIARSIMDLNV